MQPPWRHYRKSQLHCRQLGEVGATTSGLLSSWRVLSRRSALGLPSGGFGPKEIHRLYRVRRRWPRARQRPPATEAKSAPRLSIVVLPFSNLSNDPDQEYFADGITDDLTSDLSRISGSFVIARTTAFTYKGKPIDVKQIGHELGVHYVLEGSVRRTGDQVRVNAQLIDAETGAHLWADQFDTDRANLAQAQSEITGRLAWTLNIAAPQRCEPPDRARKRGRSRRARSRYARLGLVVRARIAKGRYKRP